MAIPVCSLILRIDADAPVVMIAVMVLVLVVPKHHPMIDYCIEQHLVYLVIVGVEMF